MIRLAPRLSLPLLLKEVYSDQYGAAGRKTLLEVGRYPNDEVKLDAGGV